MRSTLTNLAIRAHGGKFVYQDTSATYEYGFMQVTATRVLDLCGPSAPLERRGTNWSHN